MVLYTCDTCKKTYTHKSDYDKHLKRKNSCANKTWIKQQDINEYDLILKKIEEFENKIDELKTQNKKLEKKIKKINKLEKLENKVNELTKQNKKLEKKIEKINIKSIKKVKNINVNDSNNSNVTINILAFGENNYDCLTEKECNEILKHGFLGINKLVELTHVNKNKPELHNLFLSNKKDNNIFVFDGNEWKLTNKKETIENLINNGYDYMITKYDEYKKKNKLNDATLKKLERLKDSYDESDDVYKTLYGKDIELLLYNNRKLIKM